MFWGRYIINVIPKRTRHFESFEIQNVWSPLRFNDSVNLIYIDRNSNNLNLIFNHVKYRVRTFNNISVILWRSVLLGEETGENHRQTLSQNLVLSTHRHGRGSNSQYMYLSVPLCGIKLNKSYFVIYIKMTQEVTFLKKIVLYEQVY